MGPKTSSGHYATLGVDNSSSSAAIKAAFRKLALQHHPDRESGNAEMFRAITEAYDVLSDDKKRAAYRATMHHSTSSSSGAAAGASASSSYQSTYSGYGYGYGSSSAGASPGYQYGPRPRISFWHALSKGVGARKLEAAIFAAMAGISVAGLLSVDTMWEYNNRGKGFDAIGKRASLVAEPTDIDRQQPKQPQQPQQAQQQEEGESSMPGFVPLSKSKYQPQPYHSNPGGPNPAKMSLVELIKLEEEEAEKQQHLRQQQQQQQQQQQRE